MATRMLKKTSRHGIYANTIVYVTTMISGDFLYFINA